MPLPPLFLDTPNDPATPIHPIRAADWSKWIDTRPATLRTLAAAHDFKGQAGRILLVPATDGSIERVLFGLGDKPTPLLIGLLGAGPLHSFARPPPPPKRKEERTRRKQGSCHLKFWP